MSLNSSARFLFGKKKFLIFTLGGLTFAGGLSYQPLRRYCNGPMVDPKIMEQADLTNKVIVITGVSPNGIGYETCKCLLEKNATIVMGVRDLKKGEATSKQLIQEAQIDLKGSNLQGMIHVFSLDLNDLDSVKHFSDEVNQHFDRCDILINNEGISDFPHGLSKQHVEVQFAVNHLGHFLLTNLLLNKLKDSKGRVISV